MDDVTTGTLLTDTTRARARTTRWAAASYYLGHLELQIPLGSGARELGLRPSIFTDVGAVFGLRRPTLTTLGDFAGGSANGKPSRRGRRQPRFSIRQVQQQCISTAGELSTKSGDCATGSSVYATNPIAPFQEVGISAIRLQAAPVGGLRSELEFAVRTIQDRHRQGSAEGEPGDETKLFTFNVGTQF